MDFAQKVIAYHDKLDYAGDLPIGISVMNPYKESAQIREVAKSFYSKYYGDNKSRRLILGINPGRLGAGSTGIPFTDTKRLEKFCGISVPNVNTHEPSSVFVYELIQAFGGPDAFYDKYYINSVCPLGFTIENGTGKVINYNYYDRKDLQEAVEPFIISNIQQLIKMGCDTDKVFCLGTGKNAKYLKSLNDKLGFFGEIVPLEHPRYVMQYKLKMLDQYIVDFISKLDW